MKITMKILTVMAIAGLFLGLSTLPIAGQQNIGDEYVIPIAGAEGYVDSAPDTGTGAVDFLFVDGYNPWAVLVINAGDPDGVDMVTVSFDVETDTLTIEATDSNSTNFAAILVNKAFADKYIGESEDDMDFELSDAVNYQGIDNSNASAGGGAVYMFLIEHFSTQTIEMAGQIDFDVPVDGADAYTSTAENIGGTGAVDFLFVEGYTPWAAMVVNAGDPNGVDMVTVSFDAEADTLTIEATDSNSTNFAAILVNKAFADKYIGESEDDMDFELSDAVNYQGIDNSNASAGGGAVYMFLIEHFSTQTIEMAGQIDFDVPVDGADAYTSTAENIGGTGAVDFLFVEGYTPWAAMVVNAGDPNGVDMVTISFDTETDTLSIELTDSDSANHATVLVNKAFADKYIGESEDDLAFELSDAVNFDGMDNSNASTGGGAVYVFQIEHFSTQTIEISGASQEGIPFMGVFSLILLTAAVAVIVGIRKRR